LNKFPARVYGFTAFWIAGLVFIIAKTIAYAIDPLVLALLIFFGLSGAFADH
jgi:hypothetical protein